MSSSVYEDNLRKLYDMLNDIEGSIERAREERERLEKRSECDAATRRRIIDEIDEQQRLKHKAEQGPVDDFKAKYNVSRVSSVITSPTPIPGAVEIGSRYYTNVYTEEEHNYWSYEDNASFMYEVNVDGLEDEVNKTKELDDKAREHFRVMVESLKSIRELSNVHFEEAIYRVTRMSSNNYFPLRTQYDTLLLLFDEVFSDVAEEESAA